MAKTERKIHAPSADADARAVNMSLCNWPGSELTDDPAAVTCKGCLRVVARAEKVRRLAEAKAIINAPRQRFDAIPLTRWLEGLPTLSPETYAAKDCTCGSCAVCTMINDVEIEHSVRATRRGHGLKGEHRWTSVTAALEAYATLRIDGYSAGKSVQAAFEELARVGAFIQGGTTDPLRRSHHEAAELARIETTLEAAYASEACGAERAITILLLRVVGIEETMPGKLRQITTRRVIDEEEVAERAKLDPLDVRAIVRRGRRALEVELAARELIPPPAPTSRRYPDFLKRADELESTRVA